MKGILKIEVELTEEILEREASLEEIKDLIADEILDQLDMIDEKNIFEYVEFTIQ